MDQELDSSQLVTETWNDCALYPSNLLKTCNKLLKTSSLLPLFDHAGLGQYSQHQLKYLPLCWLLVEIFDTFLIGYFRP